jgi:CMP-N-acetylneuraminic acid synthetase
LILTQRKLLIAIIPIFIDKSARKVWCTSEGKTLLKNTFKAALNAQLIEKIYVFTNHHSIKLLSDSIGLSAHTFDITSNIKEFEIVPPGTYESLEYLSSSMNLYVKDLLVLNFRNPLVKSDLIDKAINQFHNSKSPILLSVRKSIDHPCQLSTYYKAIDVGFIHLFDDDKIMDLYLNDLEAYFPLKNHKKQNNGKKIYLSKPFYFNWEGRGIHRPNTSVPYVSVSSDSDINYVPLESYNGYLSEMPSCLWIYHSQNMARVLFNMNNFWQRLRGKKNTFRYFSFIGASIPTLSIPPALLYRDPKEETLYLSFFSSNYISTPVLLRVIPVKLSGLVEEMAIEVHGQSISDPFLLKLDEENICGLFYSLLQVTEDDFYDLEEHLHPALELWEFDKASGMKVNLQTKNEIIGRQDFPEVFEPEGTLIIGKKDMFLNLESHIFDGCACGFIMSNTSSIQIRNSMDMIRYSVLSKSGLKC